MTLNALLSKMDGVADWIEGVVGFTVGCVILIGGILLGFFPEVHEDMRSKTLSRFNYRPIRWCYKQGDELCRRTRCANCLWLFYGSALVAHLVWTTILSARGASWLVISGCAAGILASVITGRLRWRWRKVQRVRHRLDRVERTERRFTAADLGDWLK